MLIQDVDLVKENDICRLSFNVCYKGKVENVWFSTDAEQIAADGDFFLSTLLLPAMRLGETLVIEKAVSPPLLENVGKLQDIFNSWYPKFEKIAIEADVSRELPDASPRGVACFFSGGIDSFYSLIKNNDEITTLIYVQGFDAWVHETDFLEKVHPRVKKIAAEFGKKLITVRTNIHEFSDKFAEWAYEYHGCALASVAHLLSPVIRKIYIPSSCGYKYLLPYGSHLVADQLWSTNKVDISNDGEESTRPAKVKRVSENRTALENLRVCLNRKYGNYNCGKCEKCQRTMLNLYIYDKLKNCNTFSRKLSLWKVARVKMNSDLVKAEYLETMKALKLNKPGSPYVWAVKFALIRYEIKRIRNIFKSIFGFCEFS